MRPSRRTTRVRARRTPHATAAALGVSLLLAACTTSVPTGTDGALPVGPPASGPGAEPAASTLRVGLGRDPLSLDPRHVADDEGDLVVRALFDGLVDVSPGGGVVASAATWEVEDGGLTYRFTLRADRFHDGTPVTASDHAAALLAVLDPERAPLFREGLLASVRGARVVRPVEEGEVGGADGGARGSDATGGDVPTGDPGGGRTAEGGAGDETWGLPEDVIAAGGVEVLGPRELVVRLERPDPLLLHRLADPVLVPLPELARSDPERFALEPVGNGPFRMVGPREPGAFIRLAAHPGHPRPPLVDQLVLQVYASDPDRSQRWEDLRAGRLQVTSVPVDRLGEARELFGAPLIARQGTGLHVAPVASLYAYGFATDVPPFDDLDLRRAISAAIDRESLVAALAPASVDAAHAILPATLGGDAVGCAHCRLDVDLAREAIALWRARLPEGSSEPTIVLHYPRGGVNVTVAEAIAADLEGVLDLDVRLQSRDLGAFVRTVAAGDAGLFRHGMRADLGGRAAAVSLLTSSLGPGSVGDRSGWTAPGIDALVADASAGDRDALLGLERSLLDAAVLVPLLWTRPDVVVHPDVTGFRMDAGGRWWPELVGKR